MRSPGIRMASRTCGSRRVGWWAWKMSRAGTRSWGLLRLTQDRDVLADPEGRPLGFLAGLTQSSAGARSRPPPVARGNCGEPDRRVHGGRG